MQRLLRWGLPVPWSRFLWRQPGEFPATAFLLGAGTGGLLAIGKCGSRRAGLGQGRGRVGATSLHLASPCSLGLFQLLVNPMNIYEEQKMVALYGLAS